ncbi:MAG: zinc metallopeptidase [Anaerolineae bacterium]|nr:zinc metallopeptidase [Anaerolineae bacterium]
MFFFDSNYLIMVLIPTVLISLAAQWYVRSQFSKWGQTPNSEGLTGAQVAQRILARSSLRNVGFDLAQPRGAYATGVSLERTAGAFTDHYDPRTHTVRMSEEVANKPSVAAMAVVAHELGHAQQHEQNSIFIQMRNFLLPAVSVSPQIAFGLIFAGLIFQFSGLLWLGILFFGLTVLFTVLTLPVEFDASRRGMILLQEAGLTQSSEDAGGARQVLTAAGLTYVAAAVTAILQLLYYVSLAQRRR